MTLIFGALVYFHVYCNRSSMIKQCWGEHMDFKKNYDILLRLFKLMLFFIGLT